MRGLLATVLLLVAPATAAAKPLDLDRSFGRDGIFRQDQPRASTSVVALRDGGTLHATDNGLMRLSARGALRGFTPNGAIELAPGMAVGPTAESTAKTLLLAWPLDAEGRPGQRRVIELRRSAWPVRLVRRRDGYAVLVQAPGHYGMRLVALTRDGALDTGWGEGGTRRTAGDYEDIAIAAAPDGSIVHASVLRTRCDRTGSRAPKERAVLRVRRYAPDGTPGAARRFPVGARMRCPMTETTEALVDGRGRILVAGHFGRSAAIVRLRRDLRRDRSFTASVRLRESWGTPARIERAPRGGYVMGFTEGDGAVPSGRVALFDRRGRRRALRRLKVTRNYPTSDLQDLVIDRRGGLIAAGSLRDTDIFIREDYGVPHVAVWRLRTTR